MILVVEEVVVVVVVAGGESRCRYSAIESVDSGLLRINFVAVMVCSCSGLYRGDCEADL